jgi:hypothetical protein
MESIQANPKTTHRMSVNFSLRRFLMLMTAIMTAMTFTGCSRTDSPDESGNGNGVGVTGKRLKTEVNNTGPFAMRNEFSYNSDGSFKRFDVLHDGSSKLIMFAIASSNTDGTVAKEELYYADNSLYQVYNYSYDANKKPQKVNVSFHAPGQTNCSMTINYSFQNGRKTREVIISSCDRDEVVIQTDYNYDNKGIRTTATETHSVLGKRQIAYIYNADGTLQKRTYPEYDNTGTITHTYTWEDGKTTVHWFDSGLF